MDLLNITFHGLETVQHKSKVTIHTRDQELTLPDDNAYKLVEKSRISFNKDTGIAYARLGFGWLPEVLTKFYDDAITFQEFSITGLQDLQSRLASEPLSTGGHLFFIRYSENNSDFVLILLLKDIDGYVIDKLEITESHILNLDKLHFGARINISRWKDTTDSGPYIAFLKGSNRKEISIYFKKFLCIKDESFNDPADNTKRLVAAIKDYCKENYKTENDNFEARSRVRKEIERLIKNKLPITIETIKNFVDPDKPDNFTEFLNKSNFNVQPEFMGDKTKLKALSRFTGRSEDISISFESKAIEDGRIEFEKNKDGKRILIINDIPHDLLMDLEKINHE